MLVAIRRSKACATTLHVLNKLTVQLATLRVLAATGKVDFVSNLSA